MNQNDNINMYEGLASYFLPEGVLKYFEVTDFATQRTLDKDVLYTTELHIYLDERVFLALYHFVTYSDVMRHTKITSNDCVTMDSNPQSNAKGRSRDQ